jgi:hypothetical protein
LVAQCLLKTAKGVVVRRLALARRLSKRAMGVVVQRLDLFRRLPKTVTGVSKRGGTSGSHNTSESHNDDEITVENHSFLRKKTERRIKRGRGYRKLREESSERVLLQKKAKTRPVT